MFKKVKQYLGVKARPNNLPVPPVPENNSMTDSDSECEDKIDIAGSLPIELFYEILLYLSWYDLRSAWNCCKKWRNRMETFWKIKCTIENYFECEDDLNSELYRNFLTKYSRWHGIYMYNGQLENNWIKQYCREIVANYKMTGFLPSKELCYFSGDVFIVINNQENIIVVIDATTGAERHSFWLWPINLVIRKVTKCENRLIAVSEMETSNGTIHRYAGKMQIMIWNIETRQFIKSIEAEIEAMVNIVIYQDLVSVITCIDTINVINIKTSRIDYERNGVTSVFHCSDRFAVGTNAGTIIIMNLDYTELMIINCFASNCRIDDIQMKGKYLIGLSQNENAVDFRASVWNLKRNCKLYQIQKLVKAELRIYVKENRLAYVCQEFRVGNIMKYCRLDSGECIFTFEDFSVISTSHDFFILHETPRRIFNLRSIKSDSVVARLFLPEFKHNWKSAIWKTKSRLAYFTKSWRLGYALQIVNFEALMEL